MHLFGLLVLSLDHSGYRYPLQLAPLDLLSDLFKARMNDSVAQQLKAIHRERGLEKALRDAWCATEGCAVKGVNRERWSLEDTIRIAQCIGARVVEGMMLTLMEDYVGGVGGMPDLLLWKVGREDSASHKKSDDAGGAGRGAEGDAARLCCQARWVEVKGPGDSLRASQKAWLSRLVQMGADVQVLYVEAVSPN